MTPEEFNERVTELCTQIQAEKSHKKISDLAAELNALLARRQEVFRAARQGLIPPPKKP
jgi:hypothetical protein